MKRTLQPQRRQAGPLFAVGAVALIAATYGLARLGYGLFLPAFSATFALTPSVGGLLASGTSVLYCVSALAAARYSPGHPRLMTLLAGTTAALGSAGIAAAHATPFFVVAVLLAGLGAGFASPALVELVQRNIRAEDQKRFQSVVNSGTGFGVVAAGTLALAFGTSWRLAWGLIAVLTLAAMIAVLRADTSGADAVSGSSDGDSAPQRSKGGLRPLRRPIAAAFAAGVGSAAIWVHGRTLLEQQGGLSSGTSAMAWIALGFGGAAAVLTAPWLARRTIGASWRVTVLALAAATGTFAVAPQSALLSFGASALFGLAYTAATSVLIIWATLVSPSGAAGTSVLFTSLVLGQSVGSTLTGELIEALGFGPAFIIAAGVSAAAALGFAPRMRT
ncbi:MFS transporter [Arthrobacter sp. zg-Y1219]|uniref:MFS transporter n=1 Tax=Arthrobacter sp. zg-Y1219 TaxID=3049067 RepID=UPI0024C419DF|nr:MFS transporter [Arthrobacter sp. zg-Y1219]MDK1359880.1 MFS transporter [Arthrobacter sp. zg-Y1219]